MVEYTVRNNDVSALSYVNEQNICLRIKRSLVALYTARLLPVYTTKF